MHTFRVLLALGALSCSFGANIILLPNMGGSHYIVMARLADELVNRGHKATFPIGACEKPGKTKANNVVFQVNEALAYMINHLHELLHEAEGKDDAFPIFMRMQAEYCSSMLNDTDALAELQRADIILTDSVYPCGNLVAAKYSLPLVIVARRLFTGYMFGYGIPNPPSYVPGQNHPSAEVTGFLQRARNILSYRERYNFFHGLVCPIFNEPKTKFNITPHESIAETLSRVDLILVQLDFPIEVPRPLLPNTKVVGPFMPGPAKPLPPDLEEFVQSSGDDGVIVVSFGTYVHLYDDHLRMLATAFSKLPQKIIFKYSPDEIKFPFSDNVRVMSWIPQNDLTGHSKMKLLLGHGGINSLFECIYHGVPQVLSPIVYDQFSNVIAAKHQGMAEDFNIYTVTADELVQVMRTVMSQPSYRENALRLSKLVRLRPRPPVSEAADWVEYVLAVGGLSHLRPRGLDLPFYQLYLLDVLFAAVVFLLVLLWFARAVVTCIARRIFGSAQKEKVQ